MEGTSTRPKLHHRHESRPGQWLRSPLPLYLSAQWRILTIQLFSSSYDCTLRHLDFSTLKSTELFSHTNEDMLITHFDLVPNGQEAWIADKNGGISHCDFREGHQERRRWVVQEEGRAAKLGGLSVNRMSTDFRTDDVNY